MVDAPSQLVCMLLQSKVVGISHAPTIVASKRKAVTMSDGMAFIVTTK